MTEGSTLTPERLAELSRIANAATPGPWGVNPWQAVVDEMETLTPICGMLWPTDLRTEEQTLANAQHIAAFDPATALELLDRIEALEQERDAARGEVEKLRSVIRDLLPIAEARVAWEEEYESDALSSTSWIEPKRRVIARAKEVLGDDTGGAPDV